MALGASLPNASPSPPLTSAVLRSHSEASAIMELVSRDNHLVQRCISGIDAVLLGIAGIFVVTIEFDG